MGGTLWPGFSRAAAGAWQKMDAFDYTYMYSRPDAEKDCVGGGAISTIENLLDDGLISTKAKLGFPFLYDCLVGRLDLQVALWSLRRSAEFQKSSRLGATDGSIKQVM